MSIKQAVDLKDRVAVVTGGSRGIGRQVCLTLAAAGCHIAVLAKSTEDTPNLPGTIYSVAEEVRKLGRKALPVKCDMLNVKDIDDAIEKVVETFGRVDILINNASALWWQDIKDTPISKFDLITRLNARGSFAITRACLPHMEKNKFGRVVTMSPPIRLDGFAGHTAYNISKFGMTMVALGVAQEYLDKNITGNSLWPATVVESFASINFKMGEKSVWRKATILADATLGIVSSTGDFTGNMLIDDTYLRAEHGFEDKDFVQYRCDPEVEPPRLLDSQLDPELTRTMMKRGNVRALNSDIKQSIDMKLISKL